MDRVKGSGMRGDRGRRRVGDGTGEAAGQRAVGWLPAIAARGRVGAPGVLLAHCGGVVVDGAVEVVGRRVPRTARQAGSPGAEAADGTPVETG